VVLPDVLKVKDVVLGDDDGVAVGVVASTTEPIDCVVGA